MVLSLNFQFLGTLVMIKSVIKIVIILCTACILGVCFNAVNPTGVRLIRKASLAKFTTLEAAKVEFDSGKAVFVDARKATDYNAEHITGSLNIPAGNINKADLSALARNHVIITYCSGGDCNDAVLVADMLSQRGFVKVFILQEGLPGWKSKSYPTQR